MQRGGSVTSLDLDRTYWIRVKLLRCVRSHRGVGGKWGKEWEKIGEILGKHGEFFGKSWEILGKNWDSMGTNWDSMGKNW